MEPVQRKEFESWNHITSNLCIQSLPPQTFSRQIANAGLKQAWMNASQSPSRHRNSIEPEVKLLILSLRMLHRIRITAIDELLQRRQTTRLLCATCAMVRPGFIGSQISWQNSFRLNLELSLKLRPEQDTTITNRDISRSILQRAFVQTRHVKRELQRRF